jgi:heat shock protein HslJ
MTRHASASSILLAGVVLSVLHCSHNREKGNSDAQVTPSKPSGSQALALDLEKTYWKLTQLSGAPVSGAQTEPNLVLDPTTRRVGGSGGCNQFSGGYQLDGDRIRMSQTVSTMMACAKGLDTEKAFLEALDRARQWRITGQELELLDSSGKVVARFEGRRAFE